MPVSARRSPVTVSTRRSMSCSGPSSLWVLPPDPCHITRLTHFMNRLHRHEPHTDANDEGVGARGPTDDPAGTSAAARPWPPDARRELLYRWCGSCLRVTPSTFCHALVSKYHRCWSQGRVGTRLPGSHGCGRSVVHQCGAGPATSPVMSDGATVRDDGEQVLDAVRRGDPGVVPPFEELDGDVVGWGEAVEPQVTNSALPSGEPYWREIISPDPRCPLSGLHDVEDAGRSRWLQGSPPEAIVRAW
jgi:hypothetical protein